MTQITELIGKTLIAIKGMTTGSEEIIFSAEDGTRYRMYHDQDCCESVALDDVCGDMHDLLLYPILDAYESSSEEPLDGLPGQDDSFTWTFYRFRTLSGTVTLRWLGSSNGYYSESVEFIQLEEED